MHHEDVDRFSMMVVRDAKGQATDETRSMLRSESVVKAWREELECLKRELETQFSERKADLDLYEQECRERGLAGKDDFFKAKAEYHAWKGGARRFLSSVVTRIGEAKNLIQHYRDSDPTQIFIEGLKDENRILRDTLEAIANNQSRNAGDIAASGLRAADRMRLSGMGGKDRDTSSSVRAMNGGLPSLGKRR